MGYDQSHTKHIFWSGTEAATPVGMYVRSTSIWVRVWAGLLETRLEKAETETGTETIDSAHRAAKKMENFWGFDLAQGQRKPFLY